MFPFLCLSVDLIGLAQCFGLRCHGRRVEHQFVPHQLFALDAFDRNRKPLPLIAVREVAVTPSRSASSESTAPTVQGGTIRDTRSVASEQTSVSADSVSIPVRGCSSSNSTKGALEPGGWMPSPGPWRPSCVCLMTRVPSGASQSWTLHCESCVECSRNCESTSRYAVTL